MCSAELARGRRDSGFTMIELLVALVLAGILASVIFQLIEGQGRFVSAQSAREEVQQNTRGALELITSELRAVPPGGIVSAGTSSISFRLPRAWGLLCDAPVVGGGTVGVIFAPGTFPESELPVGDLSSVGSADAWGLAIPQGGAYADQYVAGGLTAAASTDGNCTANLNVGVAKGMTVRQLTHGALGTAPAAGVGPRTPVFVYQRVEYDASTSNVPGKWLRRRTGTTTSFQPVAGPLQEGTGTGLVFTYYCRTAGGSYRALTSAELANATDLLRIDRVQVKLAMQSRNRISGSGSGARREMQTDSMTVHLRNRSGTLTCP